MTGSRPSISGFTFIRNGVQLGFPFVESIRSLLPLVDEFVVAVGRGSDDTLARVQAIGDPKLRIIETVWNERMADRGFVYAQQKMIAQYACTGDWAFYLEGDELVHEAELGRIRASVDRHHGDPRIEALVFDYYHFYGVPSQLATSPAWYRRECRLIRNTIRSYAPDGQYWLVTHRHRSPTYPRAALADAHIYHYGHVRRQAYMQEKLEQTSRYWGKAAPRSAYGRIDPRALSPFDGTHPAVIQEWLAREAEHEFALDPDHVLTRRERKHRLSMLLERSFGWDLSHKHYRLVR
ncbi:glycosyltransferase [Ramlibacter sp. AW1]|uniref:Glycosyltransferase n=1 Tax=Ramlibacter aurantiacus TaxID=2801330 RepID=A0A936ZEQ2_9BURK|nr:glycosyltransferase [Ramlibacter aurantiacus]MBL0418918.1 glycosyltransferase [Ramlibacter aurantiacus]